MKLLTPFGSLQLVLAFRLGASFLPSRISRFGVPTVAPPRPTYLYASKDDDEEEDEKEQSNPYADPNYPELEFIDYSDPNYQVDQGDEYFDAAPTVEEEIAAMREERFRRNDEYQFQTYYSRIWQDGVDYRGDWTIYKTSTFLQDNNNDNTIPNLSKAGRSLQVTSRAVKSVVSKQDLTRERLIHEEIPKQEKEQVVALAAEGELEQPGTLSPESIRTEQEILSNTYWPTELSPDDFRGHQGIMVCGNAWTVCTGVPLDDNNDPYVGPFSEYRAEVGIQYQDVRLRVKWDYSLLPSDKGSLPPLHLKSMTVCRETKVNDDATWPRSTKDSHVLEALFGIPGADGGLYDPPPVGGDEQSSLYMLLDLPGRATVLFPYRMDQDPDAFEGTGWVTTLDWTPGTMRFQVDRKVHGGAGILGLRTLELSEVQSVDAATYRPKDGGRDMRQ